MSFEVTAWILDARWPFFIYSELPRAAQEIAFSFKLHPHFSTALAEPKWWLEFAPLSFAWIVLASPKRG